MFENKSFLGRRNALPHIALLLGSIGALCPQVLAAAGAEDLKLRRSIVPSTVPATGEIRFQGMDSATVTFRTSPTEMTPTATQENYSALKLSAEQGDANSAGLFGALLIRCAIARSVPYSTDEGRGVRPLPKNVPVTGNDSLKDYCAQRSTNEMASAVDWLKKGVAGGDLESMNRLAALYKPASEAQFGVLNAMWQQGSIGSLHKLAGAYRMRSESPNAEPGDATMSLASAWLYTRLNESAFRLHSVQSDFVQGLENDLAKRFEKASSQQQAEAIAAARAMLSSSKRCCAIP